MSKMLFVYNPHSGKGQIKSNLSDIVDIFTKGGYDVTVYPTQARLDGYNKICTSGKEYDMICTAGGDGTLSEAVSGLMTLGEKIPLGYIPSGSTNDFAHSMGIPRNMATAAQEIISGKYFDYDIGRFNGNDYFVYVAGFGAFTDVSYETKQFAKKLFGHAAYVTEAIKRMPKIRGIEMTVEHDGEVIKGNYILGLISNTVSIGGMKKLIANGVCLDDGLFEVVLAKTPSNPLELNALLTEAALNKMSDKCFLTFKTSNLKITCDSEIAWTLDGEDGGKHKVVEIQNCMQAVRFQINGNELTSDQIVQFGDVTDMITTPEGYTVVFDDESDIED